MCIQQAEEKVFLHVQVFLIYSYIFFMSQIKKDVTEESILVLITAVFTPKVLTCLPLKYLQKNFH